MHPYASPPPVEVVVKTYKNPHEANRDAAVMAQYGWQPQGVTGGGTRFAPIKGATRALGSSFLWGMATGGVAPFLGLLGSKKWRKNEPITITWVRERPRSPEYEHSDPTTCAVGPCSEPRVPGSSYCAQHGPRERPGRSPLPPEELSALTAKVEAGKPLTWREMRSLPREDYKAARRRFKELKKRRHDAIG